MADVKIDFDSMDKLNSQLLDIVTELDEAQSRSEELEAAIGNPYDQSSLRDRAREFEERWDEKRGELKDKLEKIQEHVKGVLDGFRDGDTELADGMESEN
ncbi:hypothetical protein [Ruania albidiflava]|uniref:hypothetical protein n=1 Tax=Ruania albidiflava TaxID=366586 RepID=UPI0023F4D31E|nr:hypothetical protein [Ruania albidiflava]